MKAALSITTLFTLGLSAKAANLTLVQEYSGSSFFDKWDFYGDSFSGQAGLWNSTPYDDTTNGDVFYMGRANGSSLYNVDSTTGHAFIKLDNTSSVDYEQKRDSIRITTQDAFTTGSVFVIDAYHLPWGCSVWPGIWTKGENWPEDGEIDIVEGVNRMTYNQMALHTVTGCTASTGSFTQSGQAGTTDCAPGSGCTVIEKQANSYGPDFESNGGGVWATQFDQTGVFIWFWSRANVPDSITSATDSIDISSWGTPSAAYSSSTCDINKFFGPQHLVVDITLCGDWAGDTSNYEATCNDTPTLPADADPKQRCYVDNVINNGTADYAMAYFEFASIRIFSSNSTAVVSPTSSASGTSGTVSSLAAGATASVTATGGKSGAGSTVAGSGSGSAATSASDSSSTTGSTGAGATISPNVIGALTALSTMFAWMLL